jgi:hypothetical protein
MRQRTVRIAGGIVVIGILFLAGAVGVLLGQIRQAVEKNCRSAQAAHPHPGEDVAALVDYMNSSEHTPQERTHLAVWTLGRLGDNRALPALTLLYTGEPCDHANALCQYELEKAIRRCGGESTPREVKDL